MGTMMKATDEHVRFAITDRPKCIYKLFPKPFVYPKCRYIYVDIRTLPFLLETQI